MIQINLLPPELQAKPKNLEKIPTVKIAIGAAVLFAILTVFFYIDFLLASVRLKKMEAEWQKMGPDAAILQQLQSEVEGPLKQEKEFMQRFVTTDQPLTSILMWVSEFLPDSAWLTEFKMEREGDQSHVLVKGLALPSKDKSSIEQIETYLHQLKEKIPDANLSLTTSRQTIGHVELTQFTAVFDLGAQKKT